jgi:hypothetical protein
VKEKVKNSLGDLLNDPVKPVTANLIGPNLLKGLLWQLEAREQK